DNVLLIGDGDKITIGAPAIDGAQIGAKVVKHLKGDKVIVFKKKRRKGFRKKNGHRQYLSEIVIESIVASGATPAKKEEAKKLNLKKKLKLLLQKQKPKQKHQLRKPLPKKQLKQMILKRLKVLDQKLQKLWLLPEWILLQKLQKQNQRL